MPGTLPQSVLFDWSGGGLHCRIFKHFPRNFIVDQGSSQIYPQILTLTRTPSQIACPMPCWPRDYPSLHPPGLLAQCWLWFFRLEHCLFHNYLSFTYMFYQGNSDINIRPMGDILGSRGLCDIPTKHLKKKASLCNPSCENGGHVCMPGHVRRRKHTK